MFQKIKAIIMSFFRTKTDEMIFNDVNRAKEYISQKISDVSKAVNQACVNRASVQQSIEDLEKEIQSEEAKIGKEENSLRSEIEGGTADKKSAYRIFMRKKLLEEKKKLLASYIEQEAEYERLCFDLNLQREKLQMKKGEIALNVSLGKTFTVDIEADEFLREIKINTKGKAEAAKILSGDKTRLDDSGFEEYFDSLIPKAKEPAKKGFTKKS